MWTYTEQVKELYRNPKNAGMLEDANAIGYAGSVMCGDAITLFLKINENDIITDAKFLAYGCGSAVASASILTEMVLNKTIDEILKITNMDVVNELGGLPPEKIHCSVMCTEVIEYAINEYREKQTS